MPEQVWAFVMRNGRCGLEAVEVPEHQQEPRPERLKRVLASISLREAADFCGVSPATFSGWEHHRGAWEPTPELRGRLLTWYARETKCLRTTT